MKPAIRRVKVSREWHGYGHRSNGRVLPALFALVLMFIIAAWLTFHSAPALASEGGADDVPTMLSPTPAFSEPGAESWSEGAGWEPAALQDLAEVLDWPPSVTRDGAGRLTVQRVITGTEWSKATIRPFNFRAASEAAFSAEQEDARLAGYSVAPDLFHGYAAYWATITDGRGQVVERRLHWQADAWILGVDIRSQSPRASDLQLIGEQLLTLANGYGLPQAPVGSATPTSIPLVSPSPTPRNGCDVQFSDVPAGLWAHSYIQELACKGIVSGYGDGTFRPQNPTTRGQLVKMVALSQGWRLVRPRTPTFTDINMGHTFYRYIETAVAQGVISGYSDKTFRSAEYVTRVQVAKILALAEGWPTPGGAGVALCDVPRNHWGWGYVQSAISRGIFTGYGDGCFYPDAYATRAQLAKVLVLSGR